MELNPSMPQDLTVSALISVDSLLLRELISRTSILMMEKENSLNILLIEDMEEDVTLIERVLRKDGLNFKLKCVDSSEGFMESLRTFQPDVVISDHALPRFNSLEALTIIRARLKIPFILVTGTVSEEFAVACLKQGVDDYILKSHLTRLPSAIRSSLNQHRIENLKREAKLTLKKQNADLLKINKELDNFVYGVSHNLSDPLVSIRGLLDLTKSADKRGSGKLSKITGMMETSINKLDVTIKEILDYYRNARTGVHVERIDIESVLRRTFEDVGGLNPALGSDLEINIHGTAGFHSDLNRIRLILFHLLSNSIKFRDEYKSVNHIVVDIAMDDANILIKVLDNGIGIRSDIIAHVFDMFYRGTERSNGAGLGLYVVKEIVEKLGGKIEIVSGLGEGTTLTIQLPNYALPS